jgi:hypothetical protein
VQSVMPDRIGTAQQGRPSNWGVAAYPAMTVIGCASPRPCVSTNRHLQTNAIDRALWCGVCHTHQLAVAIDGCNHSIRSVAVSLSTEKLQIQTTRNDIENDMAKAHVPCQAPKTTHMHQELHFASTYCVSIYVFGQVQHLRNSCCA